MSVVVNYKGEEILSVNTDTTKTLKTSGKYCEGDIEVINTQDGGITPTGNINITENGTYDVTEYAEAVVDVSGGGNIHDVPSEYEELAYIESSGTQWIDTGYFAKLNTEVYIDFFGFNSTASYTSPFGMRAGTNQAFAMSASTYADFASSTYYSTIGNSPEVNFNSAAGTRVVMRVKNGFFAGEDATLGISKTAGTIMNEQTYSFPIFGTRNAGTGIMERFMHMRLYRFQIGESGVVLHDFIPAKRKSDNVLGLYDTIGRTFYTNAGTGTFTGGAFE